MRTFFDCIPCFVRQALDVVRLVTDDEAIHEQVLREVLDRISRMDLREPPPVMGQYIHKLVRQLTGNNDPYRQVKDRFNRFALALYPELKEKIEHSANPLETAVRLAIAGNIIDFGTRSQLEYEQVHKTIQHCFQAHLPATALDDFAAAITTAQSILYIADNAGEIVFDRLLIEQLPYEKITLAVKASPVINDATREDARAAGINELVEVIDNGSDAPGTIWQTCSAQFRRVFRQAEVIVAKGQGNYETLSQAAKNIFFLLQAKCPVIAQHLGVEVGSLVLQRSVGTSVLAD